MMNGPFTPPSPEKRRLPAWIGLLVLAAALAIAGYLLVSARYYRTGFPLDDAWIHQTYARNLAMRGEWAFLPGVPSAGSTSPLWSLLLAAGYKLGLMPFGWTFLLGGLCLAGIAIAGEVAFRGEFAGRVEKIPWVGLFLALEWHLGWAAASGMETTLYALLVLAFFAVFFNQDTQRLSLPHTWLAGAIAGLSVWVRPDGITLLGPALFIALLNKQSGRDKLSGVARILGAFLLFFIPYLLFNRALAGSWWPNTFYAKQAEYAIMIQAPVGQRLLSLLKLPVVGAGVVLAPGAVWAVWSGWKRRNWVILAAFLWWLGYTGLYALRLPVTYQHGRYLIPSMPVYFLLGLIGLIDLTQRALSGRYGRLVGKAWVLSCAAVLVGFYGLGAFTYAQDVAIIETEMVDTAQWVASNIPPDELIAAHDIGALGYFGGHRLVDLAGLISPEVIPFIRDEDRLAAYMDQQGVRYLITFPGWYPGLILRGEEVHSTQGKFAPRLGGENMMVYRWAKQP